MWKRSFCARHPSKGKVEDVQTKRSCEASLKIWKLKMWKRSFRARLASKRESGRCENKAFVPDTLQKIKVEEVKTKLSCQTSQNWRLKLWNWTSFCETSLLWDHFAVRLLCCQTSLLWDLFAVRFVCWGSLCCETSLLWGLFAVDAGGFLCCAFRPLLWVLLAVRRLC